MTEFVQPDAEEPRAMYPKTILTLSATPSLSRVRRGSSPVVARRNAMIIDRIKVGAIAADLARELGLSRERVRQIWTRATGQPLPSLLQRPPVDRASNSIRRFWARVRVDESGCWIWTGARYPTGYGASKEPGRNGGYAHRAAYIAVKGPIPAGLTLDHLCRNKPCVNPDHLEAVSQRENILRSPTAPAAINARKTHCKNGHAFTDANTLVTFGPSGHRHRSCRACHAGREDARRAARRPSNVIPFRPTGGAA